MKILFLFFIYISAIMFGISVVMERVGEFDKEKFTSVKMLIALVLSILGFFLVKDYEFEEKAKEYPSEKYNMSVQINEHDGIVDSTYIIIPRKNE